MNFRAYFIRPDYCLCCGQCLDVCPAGAIEPSETGAPQIQNSKCRRCGICKRHCKQRAIVSRMRLQC